jgi:hypothetical protein
MDKGVCINAMLVFWLTLVECDVVYWGVLLFIVRWSFIYFLGMYDGRNRTRSSKSINDDE